MKIISLPIAGVMMLAACSAASAAVFSFNSGGEGFTASFNTASFDGPWLYGAGSGVGGSGAWSTEGQAPEINHPTTTDLTSPVLVVSSAGAVVMNFDHRWSFEADTSNWDGGSTFLSVNGGAFSHLPAASYTTIPYNGVVNGGSASELLNVESFVGKSAGYDAGTFLTSAVTLGSFAPGDTLQVRFRAAGDTNTSGGSPDWVVDNIVISNAVGVPEPGSAALLLLGLTGLLRRRRA